MRVLARVAAASIVPVLILAGLFCYYLSLFHGWLASGPPTPNPEWHRAWSARFFYAGSVCLVAAAVVGWQRWRGRRKAGGTSG
jgi:hypothetical protein